MKCVKKVEEGAEVEKIYHGRCSSNGRIILKPLKLGNREESLGLNTCTLRTGLNWETGVQRSKESMNKEAVFFLACIFTL